MISLGQAIAFAVWLAFAIAGGALIVIVWGRLRSKYAVDGASPPQAPPEGGSR